MSELFRPKTREEFLAETWEPVETWKFDEDGPVYTIAKSCHGWYSWRRYDALGLEVGFTTGRDETIEQVKSNLYFHVASMRDREARAEEERS